MNKIQKNYKIIVAISGGVDSSVTIWILKQLGFIVECVYIQCWNDNKQKCSYKKDFKITKKICKIFNVKLYKLDLSYEYWNDVFKIFINKLKKGQTPNPDILCNQKIKFNIFIKFSIKILKADFIATGHYVKKQKDYKNNIFYLKKGIDKKKDQSYFLYHLKQYQIKKSIFPLGNYKKKNIRKIANNLKLPNSNKKDSTGICFIKYQKYYSFIKNYIKTKKGKIINLHNNKIIGEHEGLFLYTIGQRKNLKIGGGYNKPLYVVKKQIKNNFLFVSEKTNKNLFSKMFFLEKIHLTIKKSNSKIYCRVKTRYLQKEKKCKILIYKKFIKIKLKKPLFAITPGQSAVFYIKNICIGGGIIKN